MNVRGTDKWSYKKQFNKLNNIMKKNSGILKSLFVFAVFGALIGMLPACNVSTANLSDVKLCTSKGSSGDCQSDMAKFPADVQVIYCTASVNNAPEHTKITFEWKKGSESMGKADVETSSGVVSSNFSPNAVLEPGTYSCTVKINTDNAKPVTKEFTIE